MAMVFAGPSAGTTPFAPISTRSRTVILSITVARAQMTHSNNESEHACRRGAPNREKCDEGFRADRDDLADRRCDSHTVSQGEPPRRWREE